MQVAQTILSQLGGNKFIAMTGARSFSSGASGLGFVIPVNNKKRISGVRIDLKGDDTYTLTFIKRVPFPKCIEEVAKHEGAYADNLQDIFTAETGLRTSL